MTLRGAEPPHLLLIFDDGLEGEDPLLNHALLFGGERICVLWCGSGSGLNGCGIREVVQGGSDPHLLFHGGGGELVLCLVSIVGHRREVIKVAVQTLHNALHVPPLVVGVVDEVREDALVPLRLGRVRSAKHFGVV